MPISRPSEGATSLIVACVAWGTVIGGAMYANLVYFPAYLADLPASAVVRQGPYGLNEGIFWGPAHLALIASLIAASWMNWAIPTQRRLILVSASIYAALVVWTILYFYPGLAAFASSPTLTSVSPQEWSERAALWRALSWVRVTLMYVGIVPLLLALNQRSEANA